MEPLIGAMPRPRWPHLQRQTSRHGKTCWYVRVDRKRPRVRIAAKFGTPKFEAEYFAAVRGEARAAPKTREAPGTLKWLWARYNNSSAWSELAKATRRQRENIMKHVLQKSGKAPLAELSRESVLKGRKDRKDTPSQANNFLAALHGLFEWAVEAGHLPKNLAEGVKRLKRPKNRGFPEWTSEDEAAFIKRWPLGTREYLAYMVHACTGLRRGDAVRLGRQHFRRDGKIQLQAEKNGLLLNIPIHPQLVEAIQARMPSGLTILETTRGAPWVKESYGNTFADWARAAGVAKNSHGIRKLAATRVAEAGASEHEMMALFGWSDPAMARVYTKAANQNRLAAQAAAKVGNAGSVVALFGEANEL